MIKFIQGPRSYNDPSKEFEALVADALIKHNCPVLDWMSRNVCIRIDVNENIMPCKPAKGSKLKIDGIVMIIMALGLSMSYDYDQDESIYEEREMIIL